MFYSKGKGRDGLMVVTAGEEFFSFLFSWNFNLGEALLAAKGGLTPPALPR